jgi:asparagine synthase (glutamine-hydrolysing)
MCGIAGIFDLNGRAPLDASDVETMTDRLAHRGPDGCGRFADARCGLGFRRLSLVDHVNGSQPMFNEARTVVTICNGEFFEYQQQHRDLRARGHVLQTACDAEILPHLYEERGIALLDDVAGQFACAIYDRTRGRFYLARDHFGICPLYYTIADGLLLFASEIKALLATRRVTRAVDLTGLDQLLSFPGVVSPTTMFKGVKSVPPGHWLCASEAGVEVHAFWDLDYPRSHEAPAAKSEGYYVEAVRDALVTAVERRLRGDVPVGCYLSGGLDSSLVAGIARQVAPDAEHHTFSISFGGTEMCEQQYQSAMVQRLRSRHHDTPLPLSQVMALLPRAIYHAESPIKETHDTACLTLAATARRHGVPAALTGQGADELFAGYIGYRFDQFAETCTAARPIDAAERRIREQLWGDAAIVYDGRYAESRREKLALYSAALRDAFDAFDSYRSLPIRKDRLAGRDAAHQRSYLDFKLRLGDHLLTDHGDRMSMAHGVEVRHPFLDLDLVRLAQEIPSSLKVHDGEEKYILKRAAAPYVPEQVLTREKFGWYTPGSPAVLRANDPYFADLLSPATIRRQGYFDPCAVERLKRQYLADGFMLNQPYESDLLTIVLTFGIFLDVFDMPAIA